MSAKIGRVKWIGVIFASSLLLSVAQADTDAPAKQEDPKEIYEKAQIALNREDFPEVMKLWTQAAELNYITAQVRLGQWADTSQYYEAAVGWFLMAAMQGDPEGQFELARMYQTGHGIEKDDAKASYWYRRSAAKDFAAAATALSVAYRTGALGLKVNLEQSKAWEAKAKRIGYEKQQELDKKLAEFIAAKKKLDEEKAAEKAAAQKAAIEKANE